MMWQDNSCFGKKYKMIDDCKNCRCHNSCKREFIKKEKEAKLLRLKKISKKN